MALTSLKFDNRITPYSNGFCLHRSQIRSLHELGAQHHRTGLVLLPLHHFLVFLIDQDLKLVCLNVDRERPGNNRLDKWWRPPPREDLPDGFALELHEQQLRVLHAVPLREGRLKARLNPDGRPRTVTGLGGGKV